MPPNIVLHGEVLSNGQPHIARTQLHVKRRPEVQVPKMLGEVRQQWAPQAFITSFKLETDETLLIKKVTVGHSTDAQPAGVTAGALCQGSPCHTRCRLSIAVHQHNSQQAQALTSSFTWQAWSSIQRYQVHAVVANVLQTRKEQVLLIHADKGAEMGSQNARQHVTSIKRDAAQAYIEKQLVASIVALHTDFCKHTQQLCAQA